MSNRESVGDPTQKFKPEAEGTVEEMVVEKEIAEESVESKEPIVLGPERMKEILNEWGDEELRILIENLKFIDFNLGCSGFCDFCYAKTKQGPTAYFNEAAIDYLLSKVESVGAEFNNLIFSGFSCDYFDNPDFEKIYQRFKKLEIKNDKEYNVSSYYPDLPNIKERVLGFLRENPEKNIRISVSKDNVERLVEDGFLYIDDGMIKSVICLGLNSEEFGVFSRIIFSGRFEGGQKFNYKGNTVDIPIPLPHPGFRKFGFSQSSLIKGGRKQEHDTSSHDFASVGNNVVLTPNGFFNVWGPCNLSDLPEAKGMNYLFRKIKDLSGDGLVRGQEMSIIEFRRMLSHCVLGPEVIYDEKYEDDNVISDLEKSKSDIEILDAAGKKIKYSVIFNYKEKKVSIV